MTRRLSARAPQSAAVSAVALMLVTTVGCSSPPPLSINLNDPWAARTLDHKYVTVSVPSDWNVGEAWIQPSSFTDLVGSFSNQSLSPPCTTSANSIECGPPLQSLLPGAILVEIWQNGSPQWTLESVPGMATTVSGLPARVTDLFGGQGYCSGFGADRSRSEFIPFPDAPDNWIEIDICSHGVAAAVGAKVMESVTVSLPAT